MKKSHDSFKFEAVIAAYSWSSLMRSLYRCFQVMSVRACCTDKTLCIFRCRFHSVLLMDQYHMVHSSIGSVRESCQASTPTLCVRVISESHSDPANYLSSRSFLCLSVFYFYCTTARACVRLCVCAVECNLCTSGLTSVPHCVFCPASPV